VKSCQRFITSAQARALPWGHFFWPRASAVLPRVSVKITKPLILLVRHGRRRWVLLFRRAPMRRQPTRRSDRKICDGLRSCTTRRGPPDLPILPVVRLSFDSGHADQSRDRCEVPKAVTLLLG
jgi:hypothetical protein